MPRFFFNATATTESDLTRAQRRDLGRELRAVWGDPDGDVPYTSAVTVAFTARLLLMTSRMTLDAPGVDPAALARLADTLARHGIILPAGFTCPYWTSWDERFGVRCAACQAVSYGRPTGALRNPSDTVWPHACWGCHTALPVPHSPDVFTPSPGHCFAACSCGWQSPSGAECSARAALASHLDEARAAGGVVRTRPTP